MQYFFYLFRLFSIIAVFVSIFNIYPAYAGLEKRFRAAIKHSNNSAAIELIRKGVDFNRACRNPKRLWNSVIRDAAQSGDLSLFRELIENPHTVLETESTQALEALTTVILDRNVPVRREVLGEITCGLVKRGDWTFSIIGGPNLDAFDEIIAVAHSSHIACISEGFVQQLHQLLSSHRNIHYHSFLVFYAQLRILQKALPQNLVLKNLETRLKAESNYEKELLRVLSSTCFSENLNLHLTIIKSALKYINSEEIRAKFYLDPIQEHYGQKIRESQTVGALANVYWTLGDAHRSEDLNDQIQQRLYDLAPRDNLNTSKHAIDPKKQYLDEISRRNVPAFHLGSAFIKEKLK